MKVKAAVLREVTKGYSIEELELEPPKAGEALVKYAYTGYCHSDLSNMMGRTQHGSAHGGRSRVRRRRRGRRRGRHQGQGRRPRRRHLDDPLRPLPRVPLRARQRLHGHLLAVRLRHHARRHHPLHATPRASPSSTATSCPGSPSHTVVPEGGLVPIRKDVRPRGGVPHELRHPHRLGLRRQDRRRDAGRQRRHLGHGRHRPEHPARRQAAPGQPAHRHRPRGGSPQPRHGAGRDALHQQLQGRPGADRPGAHRRRRRLLLRRHRAARAPTSR